MFVICLRSTIPCMLWKIAHLTSATVSSTEECNNPTTRNASFPQQCLYLGSPIRHLRNHPGEITSSSSGDSVHRVEEVLVLDPTMGLVTELVVDGDDVVESRGLPPHGPRACTAAASSHHWTSINPSPIFYLSWDKSIMSSSISLC
jgi:hypothetical protein